MFRRGLVVLLLALYLICGYAFAAPPLTITTFDAPFLFTYGTWEKRATVADRTAVLRGEGCTGQGGGGANVDLDLSMAGEYSPVLKVRVGANNKVATLRVLLRDAAEQAILFDFALPRPEGEVATITPNEGASLLRPNSREKAGKPFDLSKIRQWQIIGDWSANALDVEIASIELIPPNPALLEARDAADRKEAAERERVRKEQDDLAARYKAGTPTAPEVTEISLAAPDIIAVTIQAGKVVPGAMTAYVAKPGDETVERDRQVFLKRNGEEIGWLIGGFFKPGGKRDHLVTFENLSGDPLLTFAADRPDRYDINGVRPIAVFRKSKPYDWAQPSRGLAMRHIVYLKMPSSLESGKAIAIRTAGINLKTTTLTFTPEPNRLRSESVHVHQIGYRPDDPVKQGFLSVWLGNGGAYRFPENLTFQIIDTKTGKPALTGTVGKVLDADEKEKLAREANFSLTNVYRMDFSALKTPGIYRLVVDRVGCSYPFRIAPDVWDRAFRLKMRGLANERSGVELAPPSADYKRPRDFHPADGVPVYQSAYSVLDGNSESPELAKRSTGELLPNAWGGYHDAGDWNPRRVTHLRATMAQLEMLWLFPRHFGSMVLPIAHRPNVPDVLTEALFEIDCFRRLQKADGSVPFGIETDGDPIPGEVSFLQSMPAYVYAPDLWSSYIYAGVAGRTAKLLAVSAPSLAKLYRESALKAMRWAEVDWTKRTADGRLSKLRWEVKDDRNFAALVLYDLTGDRHWHDVFRENTVLTDGNASLFAYGVSVQRDAAFAYTQLPAKRADPTLRQNAVAAICRQADAALTYAKGNAFNLTTPDKGKPMILGFFSTPDAIELCRAHFLTHKPDYLAGAVRATQFQSGCNPNNMTYTTGLGSNPPRNPLFLDTRRRGQPAPTGLTVFGNWDEKGIPDFAEWVKTYYLNAACTPTPSEWPLTEAFFDIFLYPSQNEFVIDTWTANIYVWGYLAARR